MSIGQKVIVNDRKSSYYGHTGFIVQKHGLLFIISVGNANIIVKQTELTNVSST